MTKTNLELTKQIYSYAAKKDAEGLFSMCADDVVYDIPGNPDLPYAGVFHGKQQVGAFYKTLNELLEVTKNEIKSFTADGDKVLVEGSFGGKATATGKPFQTDWVMIWNFANGKVMKHQIFSDTSNIANALRK